MIGQDSSDLKKVSLSAFFMDRTEISNLQYRQFANWVRDSIVVHLLNEKAFFKRSSKKDSTKSKPRLPIPLPTPILYVEKS